MKVIKIILSIISILVWIKKIVFKKLSLIKIICYLKANKNSFLNLKYYFFYFLTFEICYLYLKTQFSSMNKNHIINLIAKIKNHQNNYIIFIFQKFDQIIDIIYYFQYYYIKFLQNIYLIQVINIGIIIINISFLV